MSEYLDCKVTEDDLGHKLTQYKLNDKGKTVAEFIMRKYGRRTGPEHGIAIQRITWIAPKKTFTDKQKTIEILNDIFNGTVKTIDRGVQIRDAGYKFDRFSVKHKMYTDPDVDDDTLYIWKYLYENIKFVRYHNYILELAIW